MTQIENLNIESAEPLTPPSAIKEELPLTDSAADTVVAGRAVIEDILTRRDPRKLAIVGPCSIHSPDDARMYAEKLRGLSVELQDELILVMRVYFEKPRTTIGWKGLIYDPDLDGTGDIERGLRLARRILLDIVQTGVYTATEVLEPVIPQYITDLVCWAAIGARTAESQTHRQLASGLSMPIGFKNATDGSIKVAIEGIKTAMSRHTFIGITGTGQSGLFRTRGNSFGHLVLRGGSRGVNYGSEHIAFATELMRKEALLPNVIVDCSHANSAKQPKRQVAALDDVLGQVRDGNDAIVGVMLESNLRGGRQPMPRDVSELESGLSITDACLGWDETESVLFQMHRVLAERRHSGARTART